MNQLDHITLEVCVASVDDACAAVRGGADRLELNSALELGGLTPSIGLLRTVLSAVDVPVIAMARPRSAGFCYSADEINVLRADCEHALAHDAAGIAFGILTADGEIDVAHSRTIVELAGRREAVFHRAFDVTPDPQRALEQLIDLGIRRVMTSGQQRAAAEGRELIARLVDQAAGRIEILPAGGITLENAVDIVQRTSCRQIHGSFSTQVCDVSTQLRPEVSFGSRPEDQRYRVTESAAVQAVRTGLDSLRQ